MLQANAADMIDEGHANIIHFHVPGSMIRLESNHVSAPDALLTAMRATLLPGKEWDEQMVHIEAICVDECHMKFTGS